MIIISLHIYVPMSIKQLQNDVKLHMHKLKNSVDNLRGADKGQIPTIVKSNGEKKLLTNEGLEQQYRSHLSSNAKYVIKLQNCEARCAVMRNNPCKHIIQNLKETLVDSKSNKQKVFSQIDNLLSSMGKFILQIESLTKDSKIQNMSQLEELNKLISEFSANQQNTADAQVKAMKTLKKLSQLMGLNVQNSGGMTFLTEPSGKIVGGVGLQCMNLDPDLLDFALLKNVNGAISEQAQCEADCDDIENRISHNVADFVKSVENCFKDSVPESTISNNTTPLELPQDTIIICSGTMEVLYVDRDDQVQCISVDFGENSQMTVSNVLQHINDKCNDVISFDISEDEYEKEVIITNLKADNVAIMPKNAVFSVSGQNDIPITNLMNIGIFKTNNKNSSINQSLIRDAETIPHMNSETNESNWGRISAELLAAVTKLNDEMVNEEFECQRNMEIAEEELDEINDNLQEIKAKREKEYNYDSDVDEIQHAYELQELFANLIAVMLEMRKNIINIILNR